MSLARKRVLAGLFWIAACAASVVAGLDAVAAVSAWDHPATALRLSPGNGKALTRSFDTEVLAQGDMGALSGDSARKWQARARQSLRDDPLQAGVLRILAFASSSGSAGDAGRTLTQLSERVSRRDLATQMWLIEDAVARNNVTEALEHYDKALSVHPRVGEQLFPILAGALDQPDIRRGLIPYLRSDRPWVVTFLLYAAQNGPQPAEVAKLFDDYGGSRRVPAHRPIETELLQHLVATGHVAEAWHYAGTMAGKEAQGLAEMDFSQDSLDGTLRPFTWLLSNDPQASASFTQDEGVSVTVDAAGRAVVASRVLVLAQGRWRFGYTAELPPISPMSRMHWDVQCVGEGGASLVSQDVPARTGIASYHVDFAVPANCPAVVFNLVGMGPEETDDTGPSGASFRRLTLRRLNGLG